MAFTRRDRGFITRSPVDVPLDRSDLFKAEVIHKLGSWKSTGLVKTENPEVGWSCRGLVPVSFEQCLL